MKSQKIIIDENKNNNIVDTSEMIRSFNTAILTTRSEMYEDYTSKLENLLATPAFNSIMTAIHDLSVTQNISQDAAAQDVVKTFREIDNLWKSYLIQEGISKLKEQMK